MPVAVGGVELKIPQAVQVGEGIIGEQRGDARTRLLAKLQPAGAIECREKMSGRGTIRQQRADVLEEAAAAAVIVERAGRPKGQPRIIGQFGTVPEGGTAFGQTVEWSQERRLQRGRSRCYIFLAQKKFSPAMQGLDSRGCCRRFNAVMRAVLRRATPEKRASPRPANRPAMSLPAAFCARILDTHPRYSTALVITI